MKNIFKKYFIFQFNSFFKYIILGSNPKGPTEYRHYWPISIQESQNKTGSKSASLYIVTHNERLSDYYYYYHYHYHYH